MVGQVSLASCEYDRDTDEFYKTGLKKEKSLIVKPPFVKQSPFVMECKLYDIVHLGNKPASGNLILGEIVMFHISEDILNNQDRIDPVLLDAVSRMGGSWYSQSKKGLFELKKPRWNGIGFDSIPKIILNSKSITANELSKLASVENRPDILKDLYNSYIEHSLDDLENTCKKFINNDELDKAWTIVSIIEEK